MINRIQYKLIQRSLVSALAPQRGLFTATAGKTFSVSRPDTAVHSRLLMASQQQRAFFGRKKKSDKEEAAEDKKENVEKEE